MPEFSQLQLTCELREEAEKIADALLAQKLIACAKFMPIESKFWWKGNIETSKEVLVMMESLANNFEKIEAEVAKLHSYETFVLQAMPVANISKQAQAWLQETIN